MRRLVSLPPNPPGAEAGAEPGAPGPPGSPAEFRKLSTLVEVSDVLAATLDLRQRCEAALGVLQRRCGILRASLTLLAETGDELEIQAAVGLSAEGQRARYKLGEGITGRVAAQGRPIVVPRVSQEPRFIYRAASREERRDDPSFVCIPLMLDGSAVGTLSVDLPYLPDGAHDRLVKFLRVVGSLLAQALRIQRLVEADRRRLLEENTRLRGELRERIDVAGLVGRSSPMQAVLEQIAQVAPTNTTVLIRGESGTGKELIAQALHHRSPRAGHPFVTVNCAALPENLVESELFGHERGAFTGAAARRKGRFELADGGTIFLDEVAELRPAMQAKLLRVLQEREFERVGGTETLGTDVRIIAATNCDLEQSLAAGNFREDLYYRLNVFPIFAPPLRQRRSDIPLLADHFVERYARAHGRTVTGLAAPTIDMLMRYHWPGNIRELENVIERAVLLTDDGVIRPHHLPPTLQPGGAAGDAAGGAAGARASGSLAASVAAHEKSLIEDALRTTYGNRAAAARLLQSTERIVNYKIRKYGIEPRRFRA